MSAQAAMTPADASNATASPQTYADDAIRLFTLATVIWAIIGMAGGVFIAAQLAFPWLNFHEWINFGRFRPVHTSGVILGFGGNALFATSFYVVQRTCQTRLFGPNWFHLAMFWSFQGLMLVAAASYLLGYTQSKEYAEPEWIFDIIITLWWVAYLVIFVGTVFKRKEPHIYVANWFFMAFILAVAMLHITNNISIPVSLTSLHSYSVYSGVQSAMIQWWYGHNMVGFFLTAGFIGIMYYFVPKQAERPIYSYRLSIVHFWALVFLYIWAGPHHLHYTSLPDWAQTLGVVFSVMLWMPSWGGMVNGIMTLSGAWHKLRTDPIMRFLVVAVAFYGMSTFEGPLMSIKEVNALSHYTDWTVGHVHSGALGWVAFIAFGAVYYLVPRLWRRNLHSVALIEVHFWLASIGILLYITAMWVSGITQGLMWRTYDENGFLLYTFSDTVAMLHPYYVTRFLGGVLYVAGVLVMAYNILRTITGPIVARASSTIAPAGDAGLTPAE